MSNIGNPSWASAAAILMAKQGLNQKPQSNKGGEKLAAQMNGNTFLQDKMSRDKDRKKWKEKMSKTLSSEMHGIFLPQKAERGGDV